jgi:type IV secretion system protein VirB11
MDARVHGTEGAVALRTFLRPIAAILNENGVTEISVNQPGEAWVERLGNPHMQRVEVPGFDATHLDLTAKLVAEYSDQEVSAEHPLLSGTIPGGYRIQVVRPPATEPGIVAMSIRKPGILDMTMRDYRERAAFTHVNACQSRHDHADEQLLKLYAERQFEDFIIAATQAGKVIVISAGTNAGKTTLLNALLKEVPAHERIITLEDTREVKLVQPNKLHLLASRGQQSTAKVTQTELLQACLRLRPNRIVLGELRGAETHDFLDATNTGHGGSITTVHASSPLGAIKRMVKLAQSAHHGFDSEFVLEEVLAAIDIIIQFERWPTGERIVSQIYYAQAIEDGQSLIRHQKGHLHAGFNDIRRAILGSA